MSKHLSKLGHDVTIYTTNLDYPKGERDVPTKVPIIEDGYTIFYFSVQNRPYLFSLSFAKKVISTIKSYDIIHINGLYRFPQTFTAYCARLFSRPYIIRPYGSLSTILYRQSRMGLVNIKRIYEKLIEFPNINRSARVHYTTNIERYHAEQLGIRAKPMVVPMGIESGKYKIKNTNFRKKYNLENKFILLFYGRINFVKGLDIIINAFHGIVNEIEGIHLVIAGPDNDGYLMNIKNMITKSIENNITITGMLYGEDAFDAFRSSDLFILPSYSDSFGISVIEAMAAGLPVIVSKNVGICDVIQEGEAGIIVDCDIRQLKEAIIDLYHNKGKRIRLGKNAEIVARNQFEWTSVINRLEKEYEMIKKEYQK